MSTESQKGYVIATIHITDRDAYMNEYIPPTLEVIEKHGGRVLVGEESPELKEGEWEWNWTVVLEFPSVEDAQAWYDDEEYESVRPIRYDATEAGSLVIAPEFGGE
jgi:uncharacterized protein (DUF1330 family)